MTPDFARAVKDADDDALRELIEGANSELLQREARRKEEARTHAQAILAKAAEEARAVLQLAGLPFTVRNDRRVRKAKTAYRAGHDYRHPDDGKRRWNGKGVRPAWVRQLEREGRAPEEVSEP